MITNIKKIALYVFALSISVYSYSHHAFTAEFDANAPVNLTGKVLKSRVDKSTCLGTHGG